MADPDEFKDALPGAAAKVDALRGAGLRGLSRLAEARQAGFARERERLSRKLGPDHPRVKAAAARIEGAAALRRDLTMEVARAETAAPQAGSEDWALHGYVRGKDLSPAPDVTVSLVDARGQWLQALGFACTDARGYFRLLAKIEHAADATVAILSGYVRVTDADRKELYRDAEALSILPGAVEYREIVLEGGSRAGVPPDDEAPGPGPAKGSTKAVRPPRRKQKP